MASASPPDEASAGGLSLELFGALTEGGLLVDRELRCLVVNDAAARHLRVSRGELLGRSLEEALPIAARARVLAALRRCLEERAWVRIELELPLADGSVADLEAASSPTATGALLLTTDRTERKRAAAREAHLASVLRSLRSIHTLMLREKDPLALVQQACALLTESRGYLSAWLGLYGEGGELRLVASAGLEDRHEPFRAFLAAGSSLACLVPLRAGAAFDRRNDQPASCGECPLAHFSAGSASVATTLRHDGRDYGVLSVRLPPRIADDEEERSLLAELAADLAFALHALEAERAAALTRDALRESEERYRSLFDYMLNGIAYCKMLFEGEEPVDWLYVAVNSAFEAQTGLRGAAGKRVTELIPGIRERDPELFERYARVVRTGVPERFETWVDALEDHFEVSVYRPRPGHFVAVFNVVTEHRRSAEALTAANSRFAAAMANMTDAMLLVDAHGRLVEMNDACATFFRCDGREEFARVYEARTQLFVVTTLDGEPVPPSEWALARALRGERVPLLEARFHRLDKRAEWVGNASTSPIRAPDGSITGALLVARDVTEQRAAELALAESRRRFATIFEASAACIAFTRLRDDVFVDANPSFAALFKLQREELLGKTAAALHLWHSNNREFVLEQVRRTGRAEGFEMIGRCADGTTRDLVGTFNTVNLDGEACLLGTLFDVTDLRRAERDLRASEERFRTLVERAPFGVMVHAKGRVLYVNAELLRVLGAQGPAALLGREVLDFVAPPFRALIQTRVEQGTTDGPAALRELTMLRLDGSPVEVEANGGTILFEGQSARLGFVHDITDRRRHEQERRELEAQLFQAQRLESVGRLAGGVAHDYNNLLTVINSYAESALEELAPGAPLQENFSEILQAGRRAASLTQQLLAFSRKQVLHPTVLDLRAVVAGIERMLGRLLGEHVELRVSAPLSLDPVKADAAQLEQVLVNLVVNARDAMPRGGRILVQLSNERLEEGFASQHEGAVRGPYVLLSVSDQGVGMDPETLRRAVEPFFTTKERGRGTGLGLATVYGIVRQSGGFLDLQSEVGVGTTVRVYLPRAVDPPVPAAAAASAHREPQGHECVLLVEDEPPVRTLLTRILSRLGYRVLVAPDGAAALAAVESSPEPPALVVTDVVMPGMSGPELVKRLRERTPSLPVLYVSGYADGAGQHSALEPDAKLLPKPFTIKELAAHVRKALEDAGR